MCLHRAAGMLATSGIQWDSYPGIFFISNRETGCFLWHCLDKYYEKCCGENICIYAVFKFPLIINSGEMALLLILINFPIESTDARKFF